MKKMNLKKIKKHVWNLATLPVTDDPVISCYMTLENGQIKNSRTFERCLLPVKQALLAQKSQSMRDALTPIRSYLADELLPDAKGIAMFSRSGSKPFFLPLQFHVPLPYWAAVDSTPNIYHLVELKETYHRYIILVSSHETTRILEVNVGPVTKELWTKRPERRKRIGQEWTKTCYQKHYMHGGRKYIREEIKILKRLISGSGKTHLILAGHPARTEVIKDKLPKCLLVKLVDLVPLPDITEPSDVVRATIGCFVRAEEEASEYTAELLFQEIQDSGRAVVGLKDCLKTLKENLVDILVLHKTYSPGKEWICTDCGFNSFDNYIPRFCYNCNGHLIKNFKIKEEMVRLAEHIGAKIQLVRQNDALNQLGGVGCILH
ncbi:MAG: hypothetical protein HOC24_14835 [Deltaproteobacteria bacterium]|nr:hypothetical protein [Deltaproteobacteria bacterium]